MSILDTSGSRRERFAAEALAWGISVGERLELERLCHSKVEPAEKNYNDAWKDSDFRLDVADILTEAGLFKKAKRYLACSRMGFVLQCKGPDSHKYFSPSYCDLRFCRICSHRRFSRLFAKHSQVLDFLARNPRKGYRLRQITLTSKNTGVLTHEAIVLFNAQVKKTLGDLLGDVDGWGAIAVLEFGHNNTNLHVHILAWCPYIEQAQLAKVWNKVSGHQVVWINESRVLGKRALLYMLKYVGKPPSDKAEVIGQLEVAFHKTRRVHCYGLFYNFSGGDTDAQASEWMDCPACGAALERVKGGLRHVYQLRQEGLHFIGDFPRKAENKKWVN